MWRAGVWCVWRMGGAPPPVGLAGLLELAVEAAELLGQAQGEKGVQSAALGVGQGAVGDVPNLGHEIGRACERGRG